MMHLSEQQTQHYLTHISQQQDLQHRQQRQHHHHHHNHHNHQQQQQQQQQQQVQQHLEQHHQELSQSNENNQLLQQQLLQQPQHSTEPNSNSPSDQSSSISNSITPPHQISSRASPASTALVMSQNNINHHHHHHSHHNNQSTPPSVSRQLTPNTNNSSPTNGGTGGSSNGGGTNNNNNNLASGQVGPQPPNPMIRHFAGCHAKSMSAGVVVSVPGISNNLATATGINQNMINNNIQNRAAPMLPPQQQHHAVRTSLHPQQVNRSEHHRNGNHHHQQLSSSSANHHNHHQQQSIAYQLGNSNNFISSDPQNGSACPPPTGSSIILSNSNINNIHNRSHSTHLSNLLLGPQNSRSHNYPSHVTNSIWSVDENISKSHGKLASSSYISQPYLFNPSTTDLSCDNVSNASRLIDGTPAPGYYLHHAPTSNLPTSNVLSGSGSVKSPEFIPICDLMFNFISMIIYFCENIFGIIALIALYYDAPSPYWALTGAIFVLCSNFTCQYLSFKWIFKTKLEDCQRKKESQEELENEENCDRRFYNTTTANMRNYQCASCTWLPDSATEVQLKFLLSIALDALLHLLCLGFLMRYIKLVIPVTDTAQIKKEARELCMLRMINGFMQSAPLVLLQAYMIGSQTSSSSSIITLSATAATLSLINVCWALASFTKYARKKYMHKFVLTWLGILSQALWRFGTVSSRVAALTIYAVYYNYWMLVILALHWITMFFWLIAPGNLLKDEVNLSRGKKVSFAMATAWIYCFCYVNFEERSSKTTIYLYYFFMFIENNLLLTVCVIFSSQVTWFKNLSMLVVYLGFVFGIIFMIIYYKHFHMNVLNNGLSCSQESVDSIADQLSPAGKKIAGFKPGTLRLKSENSLATGQRYNNNISSTLHTDSHPDITKDMKPPYLATSQAPLPQQALFTCKQNTGFKKQSLTNSHVRRHNP